MTGKTKGKVNIDVNQLAAMLKDQGIEVEGLDHLFEQEKDNTASLQEFKNCSVIHTADDDLIKQAKGLITDNCIVAVVSLADSYGNTKKGNMLGYGTTAGFVTMTIKNKGKKEDIGINVTVSSRSRKGK